MLLDRVSNPGPLTYESGALPIALCDPAPIYSCTYLDTSEISPMEYLVLKVESIFQSQYALNSLVKQSGLRCSKHCWLNDIVGQVCLSLLVYISTCVQYISQKKMRQHFQCKSF